MISPPRWLRRAPIIATPLRRLAKRTAPRGPLERTVEGIVFALAPRENKTEFDIWYKRRLGEREERDFLAANLRPGDTFVDIGANVGLYTLALMHAVEGLRAITFEPIDRLRARQERNLALNGFADRADVRATAIGPTGTMRLYESSNAGRSSLVPFAGAKRVGEVEVRPLAAILAEACVVPAAIKIDVEGFEAEALMPYFDEAPPECWPRAIVLETLHSAAWGRDCLSELVAAGYVLAGATEENALLARQP